MALGTTWSVHKFVQQRFICKHSHITMRPQINKNTEQTIIKGKKQKMFS